MWTVHVICTNFVGPLGGKTHKIVVFKKYKETANKNNRIVWNTIEDILKYVFFVYTIKVNDVIQVWDNMWVSIL